MLKNLAALISAYQKQEIKHTLKQSAAMNMAGKQSEVGRPRDESEYLSAAF